MTARGMTDAVERWLDRERDRLANWVPVCVGIGIAIWQFSGDTGAWLLLPLALLLAAASFFLGDASWLKRVVRTAIFAILLGFAAILIKSACFGQPAISKIWNGQFYGRIVNVETIAARDIVRLELETDGHAGLPPRVRVNLSPKQYRPEFSPGAIILLRARLMPPAQPALPGGYDFARRAWFAGLGATGTALGPVTLHKPSQAIPWLASARQSLARHVTANMPGGAGAIGSALVTGDQGAISESDADAMRNSGMAHLLSISGLHVTAVVGAIFIIASRLLALVPWLALRITVPLYAAAAAAAGAVGYTLLTGSQVPTVRSCVAAMLVLIALALGREALTLRLLAFGAFFVLIFWPEAMAGPSFQLSFAAVATIIVLHELPWMQRIVARREEGVPMRLARGLFSILLTGLAIELVLAPIALFHFHKTGLYGALANVIAIPLTTFVIMPAEALALLLDMAGLGAPFWWIATHAVNLILYMAHGINDLPGSVSMLPSMPIWAFGSIIAGILIFGLLHTRWRYAGIVPYLLGVSAMLMAPRPDILVTGDGKHLALVSPAGKLALLRAGAGDYIRDTLLENAGVDGEPIEIENWSGARCSDDACIFNIKINEKRFSVMATRTRYMLDYLEMVGICRNVDIVVSDRRLPDGCKPRWLKADRIYLAESGGIAIYLADHRIDSVSAQSRHMPWARSGR